VRLGVVGRQLLIFYSPERKGVEAAAYIRRAPVEVFADRIPGKRDFRAPVIFFSRFHVRISKTVSIFAVELTVERFVLLATTGKNAKTSPPGFWVSPVIPPSQFVIYNN
jgi:hypothetical protein